EGQDGQVIAVLGEDQAVEQHEGHAGATHENAEREHEARPREQRHDGHEQQQERDAGEGAQVADVRDEGVAPRNGATECRVVPDVAEADERQERRVHDGEPADPAQQPSSRAHACRPRAPTPARSSAMRAISRAPTSTLRPKLNTHFSRRAALRLPSSAAPRSSSATCRGASVTRSSGKTVPSSRRIRISIGSIPSSAYLGFRTRGGTSTNNTGLPRPRAYSIAIADQSQMSTSDSSSEALSSMRLT